MHSTGHFSLERLYPLIQSEELNLNKAFFLDRLAFLCHLLFGSSYLLERLPYMEVALVHCQVCTCSLLRNAEFQSTCGQFERDGYGV